MEAIKPYKKNFDYSYTLGAFPTFELIKTKPEKVIAVYVHSTFTDRASLEAICSAERIPVLEGDKLIGRLSEKENCFVVGIFEKYEDDLNKSRSHVVLVNPGNMGNLGTILRTCVGFGIQDIAIITPASDIFNPKTIRSSMGALFRLRSRQFESFEQYRNAFPKHEIFTFMLDGERTLRVADCPKPELFSLVFGNEATGLDASFHNVGTSVLIPQTADVDSLNLTIAVGIGVYLFTQKSGESEL